MSIAHPFQPVSENASLIKELDGEKYYKITVDDKDILFRGSDNYFNATKLAKQYGKDRFKTYVKSKDWLNEVEKIGLKEPIILVSNGGNSIKGSYIHPNLYNKVMDYCLNYSNLHF